MIEKIEIDIRYSDVMEQLRKLSSFEGREAVDSMGSSMYPELHITGQDEDLLKDYAKQGAGELAALLGSIVAADTHDAEGIRIELGQLDCTRFSSDMMAQLSKEAVSAYAMSKWMLLKKQKERMEFYNGLFSDMVEACKRTTYKKRKPSLDIYN